MSDKLLNMPARKSRSSSNHLEEAMALLIRNQAAFVEQIARNDQERLKLQITGDDWMRRTEVWQQKTEDWQRKTEDWQRKTEDWQRKTEGWQRNAEKRFDKIEQRLERIEASLIELPKIILKAVLEQLPKAVKREIGFKSPT